MKLAPEAPHLVHLSWNNSGTILAVLDACGRIALFGTSGAFGRMQLLRNPEQDDGDDSQRVVSCFWLPMTIMKGVSMNIQTATRLTETGVWSFQTDYDRTPGPCHPVEAKSALICITMSGKIRLLYDAGSGWAERSLDLGIARTSDDFLTHASFAGDKEGRLLLVTHNVCRQLQLFGMRITWNEKKQMHRGQQMTAGIDPLIKAFTLNTIANLAPSANDVDQSNPATVVDLRDMSAARLTHLQLLPGSFDKGWLERTRPVLVAVFSHSQHVAHSNNTPQEDFCVISRWELETLQPTLHPTFNELNSKAKPAKPESAVHRVIFQRKPDVVSEGLILALSSLQMDSIIAFALSDGSIAMRDRATMEVISAQIGAEQVSSLPQAGFSFPTSNENLGLCFGFSPNSCAVVAIDFEGKVKLRKMEVMIDWNDDTQPDQPIIALTSQYSIACWYSWSNDDVLATVPRNTKLEHIDAFLRYIYNPLNLSVDYATNESQSGTVNLFRYSTFARCLSAQNALGNLHYRGVGLALPTKVAWVILNIRAVAITFGITIKSDKHAAPLDLTTITLISAITKWMLDLLAFLMDELFSISNALRGSGVDKAAVSREIRKRNTPALHLLLQSIPRMLLRFNCQYLHLAFANAGKAGQQTEDAADRKVILDFMALFSDAPVKLYHFKRLIDEADGWVKKTYSETVTEETRVEAEKTMLISGGLPDVLMPVVQHLFTQMIDRFRTEVDPAKMYFYDVRWLGLTDDKASQEWLHEQKFDIHMKTPIGPKARLRSCPRCRSVMDDTPSKTRLPSTAWLALVEKSCICTGNWMAVPET